MPEDDVVGLQVGARDIAFYKNDGNVYATDNVCSRGHGRLCDGFLDSHEIECPLHQGKFDIRDGRAMCAPVTVAIRSYPVRIDNGRVFLQLIDQASDPRSDDILNRVLHTYFRSSAAYRVRIAMNLKGLEAAHVFVHLNRNGGEQFGESFRALNAQSLVPVLTDDGVRVSQSLAIMEYLEEVYPQVPLLPSAPVDRAFVRQLSLGIACDIHPINNLRVLKYLTGAMGVTEDKKSEWITHWIRLGLEAIEIELKRVDRRGEFCFGDTPTLADCCLVPQVFSAQRFDVDLSGCRTLLGIFETCQALPAFAAAQPSRQPDAE